jgi:hypothetical protein
MAESKANAEIAEPKAEDYAPYHLYPEFIVGYLAYRKAKPECPYDPDSVATQAWDRGMEYAYRLHCYAFRRT